VALAGGLWGWLALACFAPARAGAIKVLQDFETGTGLMASRQAGIAAEISPDTTFGQSCLKVAVAKDFTWRWKGWDGRQDAPLDTVRLATLSGPYLPPEADAIRMKIRMASGRAIVTVGGPVSQVGNSDVFCDPQLVDAKDGDGWRTVEFSLNQRLARNFRRPNFSGDLPVVYYTRWAQEPVYLCVAALPDALRPATDTVFFVDQVELISRGEGRPFPAFDAAEVKVVGTIADFESEQDLTNVFSVAHGSALAKSFEAGYRRNAGSTTNALPEHIRKSSPFIQQEGIPYPAPRYTRVEGRGGSVALQAECAWAEEGQIVTIKARANADANAIALAIKPVFPAASSGTFAFEYGGRRAHAVDFIVFVAPAGAEFPWRAFGPSEDLQKLLREGGYHGPGKTFDYLLTMDRRAGDFGFYTARRYVPAGAWSTAVIPFADFVCVYGHGACRNMQLGQQLLQPENIAAVGFLAPFGSGHGTIAVDDVACVHVPGSTQDLRSFWQVPDIARARLIRLPRYAQYGAWALMTLGEDAPAFLKLPDSKNQR
jgi:hypothetical protein